jgi:hypothetical protein
MPSVNSTQRSSPNIAQARQRQVLEAFELVRATYRHGEDVHKWASLFNAALEVAKLFNVQLPPWMESLKAQLATGAAQGAQAPSSAHSSSAPSVSRPSDWASAASNPTQSQGTFDPLAGLAVERGAASTIGSDPAAAQRLERQRILQQQRVA